MLRNVPGLGEAFSGSEGAQHYGECEDRIPRRAGPFPELSQSRDGGQLPDSSIPVLLQRT